MGLSAFDLIWIQVQFHIDLQCFFLLLQQVQFVWAFHSKSYYAQKISQNLNSIEYFRTHMRAKKYSIRLLYWTKREKEREPNYIECNYSSVRWNFKIGKQTSHQMIIIAEHFFFHFALFSIVITSYLCFIAHMPFAICHTCTQCD